MKYYFNNGSRCSCGCLGYYFISLEKRYTLPAHFQNPPARKVKTPFIQRLHAHPWQMGVIMSRNHTFDQVISPSGIKYLKMIGKIQKKETSKELSSEFLSNCFNEKYDTTWNIVHMEIDEIRSDKTLKVVKVRICFFIQLF